MKTRNRCSESRRSCDDRHDEKRTLSRRLFLAATTGSLGGASVLARGEVPAGDAPEPPARPLVVDCQSHIRELASLNLPPADVRKILGENARRLFGLTS